MRIQRNYYEVLGVARTASPTEIKEKYHTLARQFHPDRATDKELAQRLFVQINRAYGTLMNPEKRALYDASLFAAASATPSAPSASGAPANNASTAASAGTGARPAGTAASPRAEGVSASAPPTGPMQIKQWLDEAQAAHMKGNLKLAQELVERILSVDSRNYPALVLHGDLLAARGLQPEAVASYQIAQAIQPGNRILREKIARLEAIIARKAEAAARPSAPSQPAPAGQPASDAQKGGLFQRILNLGK